jgi:murein L,D-transpeptidase YafK
MTMPARRVLAVLWAASLLMPQRSEASECPKGEPTLLVDTAAHALKLCENGVVVKGFRVALGSGGTGKTKQGDDKTPLGVYPLGAPRPSSNFGVFIPVGYPTKEQTAKEWTGGDIGIHGPDRHFALLGSATLWVDWTAGCAAVGSDEAIQAIAAWVKAKNVVSVQLD